jgi:hypothetical protein
MTSAVAWVGQVKPGRIMLGFSSMASRVTWLRVEFVEDSVENLLRDLAAGFERVGSGHEDFRLDDGDQTGYLGKRRVTRKSLRVCLQAGLGGQASSDREDCAPFGEARSHLKVRGKAWRN